jgi:RNA polymerase sigma-70 factor (ECF subfamily)
MGKAVSGGGKDKAPGPQAWPEGPVDESVSDEALMLCVQAGELSALQGLMVRYEKGLYNFLARCTGDRHLAEDLFQDTFLRVVEKRESFDPGRGFRSWLFSISANLARDACRRRKVRSRDLEAGGERLARPEPVRPDVEAERREEMEIARVTLDKLPEDAKAMVLMHFCEGLRYREVAEIIGVPVGTVKSRIHWAVEKLARAWSESAVSVLSGRYAQARKGR